MYKKEDLIKSNIFYWSSLVEGCIIEQVWTKLKILFSVLAKTNAGSTKANRRYPKSCLGHIFNYKLGCFVGRLHLWAIMEHVKITHLIAPSTYVFMHALNSLPVPTIPMMQSYHNLLSSSTPEA
jgi:hypothetical protein